MSRCGVLIQQSAAQVTEDKQRYNEQQRTQYRYQQYTSDQLVQSLGVDWRGRAAACPPVARDHVTIPGLRDGRISKLRKRWSILLSVRLGCHLTNPGTI